VLLVVFSRLGRSSGDDDWCTDRWWCVGFGDAVGGGELPERSVRLGGQRVRRDTLDCRAVERIGVQLVHGEGVARD